MAKRSRNKPFEIELSVTQLSHEGRGVAENNGKKVFVHGALIGETVIAQVTKRHRRFDEARTLSVLKQSELRVDSPCDYFGECGGCQLQHLSENNQISHKQNVVKELLEHHAKIQPQEWLEPIIGDKTDYRSKGRIGVNFDRKKEQLLVGFRELRSNKITRMQHCKVLDKRVGEKIPQLQKMIRSLSNFDSIPQIEIACSDEIVCLVVRHLSEFTAEDLLILKEFSIQENFYIYLQPKGEDSVHLLAPEESDVKLKLFHPEHDITLEFIPLDFTQVNQSVNQKMLTQAINLLNPNTNDVILDLFCGLGNFTLPFAKYAKFVTGIEASNNMVKRGYHNAKLNNLENVEFFAKDLFKNDWCEEITKKYNKLIIDPPRSGALEIVQQIEKLDVDAILYVSCNPITLARDTEILVHHKGYKLEKLGALDMFPHTAHIESMALFIKK
jgi:23S rRNA (uracil1939-C5)-methyltransferase